MTHEEYRLRNMLVNEISAIASAIELLAGNAVHAALMIDSVEIAAAMVRIRDEASTAHSVAATRLQEMADAWTLEQRA